VKATGASRRLRRWLLDEWTAVAGAVAFATVIIWQALIPPVILWPDSTAYESVARQPLWSLGLWSGARPPLTPLLWKLTGTPTGFVVAQTMISVAAWVFLAVTVGTILPAGWRRTVAVYLVLAFATTTPVTLWDRSVLSETLALSFLAAFVASLIWVARRPTTLRIIGVAVTGVGGALARDTQIWTMLMVAGVVGLCAVIAFLRRRQFPVRAGVLACVLLVLSGACLGLENNAGRNVINLENIFAVRIFPYPDRVAWFAAHGMPDSKVMDEEASQISNPTNGTAKLVPFVLGNPHLNRLYAWFGTDASRAYVLWLVEHPLYVLTEPYKTPRRAIDFNPDITVYAATNRPSSPMNPLLWPSWWWVIDATVAACWLAPVRRLLRNRDVRVVAVLGLLALPALDIAWHGDGQEVTRHMIEAYVQLRLAVVILLIVGSLLPPYRLWLSRNLSAIVRHIRA
jgi:hypothetical protein